MKYKLFVHISHLTVICKWGKPLCGFKTLQFKTGRFEHPQARIHIAKTSGAKFDYYTVSHAIQIALQAEGLPVNKLIDSRGGHTRKPKPVSDRQLRLL